MTEYKDLIEENKKYSWLGRLVNMDKVLGYLGGNKRELILWAETHLEYEQGYVWGINDASLLFTLDKAVGWIRSYYTPFTPNELRLYNYLLYIKGVEPEKDNYWQERLKELEAYIKVCGIAQVDPAREIMLSFCKSKEKD